MNTTKSNRLIIKYLTVIVWMLIIFLLSNEPASLSSERSDVILRTVQSIDLSLLQDATEFIVRKFAHLLAYFVLGMLLYLLVSEYKLSVRRTMLVSIILAAAYACTDEIHQLFVTGRSGQVSDVLIDTTGALVGVLVYVGLLQMHRRRVQKNLLATDTIT